MSLFRSWHRVSEIFGEALDRAPAERAEFIAGATSDDPDIGAEVERLLAAHEEAGEFISEPVFPDAEAHEQQSRFMPGELLADRFRLIRFINKGGMGEVYEAEDLELHERVALKTLRPDVHTTEGTLRRFKQEIQLSRKITHPNVCRVFDIAIHDDLNRGMRVRYLILVMELLDGENLSERLARKGPMGTQEALPIIEQIVHALGAAHEAGIIHRDFKSANVMLTRVPCSGEVRAVVTDFGLAQSVEGDDISLYGSTVQFGTPAYMAPEQLEGGKTTTAADIYALGVVMYEMVTGKQVFTGTNALAAGIKKLTQNAPSPRTHVPDLDCRWEATILQCLKRDMHDRPATVRDVLMQLRTYSDPPRPQRWRAILAALTILSLVFAFCIASLPFRALPGPEAARTRSVAVLRFQNVPGRESSEWLGTALADALTMELSGTESLHAIPRQQVVSTRQEIMPVRTAGLDVRTVARIGDNLHAEFVVYGFYSEDARGAIKLNIRVLAVRDRAASFDLVETGTEQGISKLILKAAHELRKRLGAGTADIGDEYVRSSLPGRRDAARLYSEGVHRLRSNDFAGAQEQLSKAAELEPGFALTHASLASCWSSLGYVEKARDEARKALALSTSLPYEERLQVEAQYFETIAGWSKAADCYQRLWQLYPDVIEYGLHYAGVLRAGGKFREALEVIDSLRKLPSPLGDNPRIDLSEARLYGYSHNPDREYKLAQTAATKALGQNLLLCLAEARMLAGRARLDAGDVDRAVELFGEAEATYRAADFRAGVAHALDALGIAFKQKGRFPEALGLNTKALTIYREIGDSESTTGILKSNAEIFARQGQFSSAEHALSDALTESREAGNANLSAGVLNSWADLLQQKGDVTHANEKRQQARDSAVTVNPTFTR
ncbi:MAG: eukaryotic-like serine/threonine-protein kinase [Bryobacterales bacterium]|nr:eukaryotic-like serine/threonine-protein kinase [Bryobacterales bacterium]